jgi:5,10-methylenetetrahydromethanopterin reductase
MEVWLHAFSFPRRVAELAREAEQWGFTGMLVADSQKVTADVWVELGLAGAATSQLRLGPGVTNPVTRHVAVTASAAATLQAETGGRSTLGFAQGDSALSQIGRTRLPVREFEQQLETLQGLLRGEPVQLEDTSSAIRWLANSDLPKVPVHVAATGPRTIEVAARHAEGVDLTVGAELERLRWGAATARRAGSPELTVGAYVNVAVHPEADRARELVRGSAATFARFSAQSPRPAELSDVTRRGATEVAGRYEKDCHGDAAASFARRLDARFIDRFAVCGPADVVQARLEEIGACGIDRVIVVPGSLDTPREEMQQANERFARDVLPGLVE